MAATASAPSPLELEAQSFQSDSPHIAAEPALPAPWTDARAAHDRRQAEMVAGLLAGFHAHRRPRP